MTENAVGFISIVLYAYRTTDGHAVVTTTKGAVKLAQLLGEILNCKGRFDTLGTTYDPSPGVQTLVTAVFVMVPFESEAASYFKIEKITIQTGE